MKPLAQLRKKTIVEKSGAIALRKVGRPDTLTPELQKIIVERIRKGCSQLIAAGAAGISERTFRSWMARGRGVDPELRRREPYVSFAREVDRATDEAIGQAEEEVYERDKRTWLIKGASRRHDTGWSEQALLNVEDTGPVTIIVRKDQDF